VTCLGAGRRRDVATARCDLPAHQHDADAQDIDDGRKPGDLLPPRHISTLPVAPLHGMWKLRLACCPHRSRRSHPLDCQWPAASWRSAANSGPHHATAKHDHQARDNVRILQPWRIGAAENPPPPLLDACTECLRSSTP
jgi:hypothetical protein